MPRRPKDAELLAALAPVLRRRRLPWYLFGAQAVVVHGRPRVDDPLAFALRARVVPFLHRKTGLPLDLVLAAAVARFNRLLQAAC